MSENEHLQSHDVMSPLQLSDIRTPDGGSPGDDDTGRVKATFAPTSAAAGWELGDQHLQQPGVRSEEGGRLGQDAYDLKEENRLLRQKLHLLQNNSNLKQVALIGTVISWFGDKGLLEEDGTDTAERFAAMVMSARATEQLVPPTTECSRELFDDVPWEQHEDGRLLPNSVLKSHTQNEDEFSTSASLHPNENDIENNEASQWLSQSLKSSFNPPFSSSRKGKKNSINIQENEASFPDSIGNSPQQLKDYTTVPAFQVDGIGTKTVSFDEGVHRLDTRLRRLEKAVNNFSERHDKRRIYLARLRQNAVKRFRVWKAISASHELAASKASRDEGEDDDLTEQHRIIPTPLTGAAEKTDRFTGSGFNSNRTILGEIAFQVERRILAFVFQRTKLLYGYNLGNNICLKN